MKNISLLLTLLLGIAVLYSSCKKNNDDNTEDLNAVYNNAASEATYNDVVSIGDESVIDEDLSSFKMNDAEKISAPCATITRDSSGVPWTTTIDFGTTNCLCNDGKYRRGKIMLGHPPPHAFHDSGMVIHYEFMDHYVNDNKVFGTIDVTNHGFSPEGFPHFKWEITGGLILADLGDSIHWYSNQVKAYLAGYNTPNTRLDDIIGIHGGSGGVTQTGESYTAIIDSTAPLIRKFEIGCRKHFAAGTVSITQGNLPVRVMNYGEQFPTITCDEVADCEINGVNYVVNLNWTYQQE